jgi:hypothetical protein
VRVTEDGLYVKPIPNNPGLLQIPPLVAAVGFGEAPITMLKLEFMLFPHKSKISCACKE